ncbi:MAG: DNA-processing protein DprA [Alphaproteobacteria bacterium]|nr:DNA-processing protein DprA [Alphaproteobacteria bacterium]
MNKEKLISYIQLINTTGIGSVSFKKLIDRYKDVDIALKELSKKRELFSRSLAEKELMLAEIKKVKLITMDDEIYPYNLKQVEGCPPILYALGNTDLLKNNNALAIVGSRNASFSANRMAQQFSKELADSGITVVSGMARGIDASAHIGALDSKASTIAVLGTGIDIIYPKENENLYNNIKEKGLIISEYPMKTSPQASNFPRRNRIVSGLSKGVLVIEASIKSGSLITANMALEQGRDVYSIPGAPFDGRTSGCNKLLKEGAILTETPEDIINNFCFDDKIFIPVKPPKNTTPELFEYSLDNEQNNLDIADDNNLHQKLLSLISETGEDIDDIIRSLSQPPEETLMAITELELDGKLMRLPGNKVAKS